jgi:hypothetical protein
MNQPHENDALKDMSATKKEWDQMDIWLAKYGQNTEKPKPD